MDARQRRTRARLFAAVLELAGAEPIAAVTMTRIAQVSGVHRSTVYEHAASSAELLRIALSIELDEIRERHLAHVAAGGGPAAVTRATLEVFEHVAAYADIYSRELESDGANLHLMLSDHIRQSILDLVHDGVIVVPFSPATIDPVALTARYMADGIVGAIAVWLRCDPPRDAHELFEAVRQLNPPWWPGRS